MLALVLHNWRRGPVTEFTGNSTAYVCVRCGSSTKARYDPEIPEYDAKTWYPLLYLLDRHKEYTNFDSYCIIIEEE